MEVPRHFCQGRQEKVPKAVPFESLAGRKTVLEEPRQQGLILRQRDHAVTNVARGEDVEVTAEPARAPPVVTHGYDRGEIELTAAP